MNNTFIIVLFLLDLPRNALFCKGFRGYCVICSKFTDCGKSEQDGASCYYLLVVKLVVTSKRLLLKNLAHFCTKFFI